MDEDNEFGCNCCWCYFMNYDMQTFYREQATWMWSMRNWLYQQCTEWGFMFSVNYGKNIYEDSLAVK